MLPICKDNPFLQASPTSNVINSLSTINHINNRPRMTIKYGKLQIPYYTFIDSEKHDYENRLYKQSASLLAQNNEIPVIPNGSFETVDIRCSHGTCKKNIHLKSKPW